MVHACSLSQKRTMTMSKADPSPRENVPMPQFSYRYRFPLLSCCGSQKLSIPAPLRISPENAIGFIQSPAGEQQEKIKDFLSGLGQTHHNLRRPITSTTTSTHCRFHEEISSEQSHRTDQPDSNPSRCREHETEQLGADYAKINAPDSNSDSAVLQQRPLAEHAFDPSQKAVVFGCGACRGNDDPPLPPEENPHSRSTHNEEIPETLSSSDLLRECSLNENSGRTPLERGSVGEYTSSEDGQTTRAEGESLIGHPSNEDAADLKSDIKCTHCAGINLDDMQSASGYRHIATYRDLISSASSCRSCNFFVGEVEHSTRGNEPLDINDKGPIQFFIERRQLEDGYTLVDAPRMYVEGLVSHNMYPHHVYMVVGNTTKPSSPRIQLDMFTDNSDCAAARAGVAVSRNISYDPASQFNFEQIREWLAQCEKGHSLCSLDHISYLEAISKDWPGPRRLIHVSQWDQIRLVDCGNREMQYVALSYCWGKQQTITTTQKNLTQMYAGIQTHHLNASIRDAVRVVRKLNIDYIWVDALCIVQDDRLEWESEARNMSLIYGYAYFTIAATSAESAAQGFLSPRSPRTLKLGFKQSLESLGEGTIRITRSSQFGRDYDESVTRSPLLRRAWVKQERLLSRRTVDFAESQIYFTCRANVNREDGHDNVNAGFRNPSDFLNVLHTLKVQQTNIIAQAKATLQQKLGRIFRTKKEVTRRTRSGALEGFFITWQDLVADYVKLELTRESDRLPAVEGLAEVARAWVPGCYLSGIWEEDLAAELLWSPSQKVAERSNDQVPSWSWATYHSGISYSRKRRSDGASRISLLEAGKLIDSGKIFIKVKAVAVPCNVYFSGESRRYVFGTKRLKRKYFGDPTLGYCEFDGFVQTESGTMDPRAKYGFWFLRISCFEDEHHHCRGLLLDKIGEVYRRVGLCWTSDQTYHELPSSEIVLV